MSVEDVKRESRFLRGVVPEELADGTDAFGHDSQVLLKFHGIYQQDDRDVRRERTQQKLGLDYSCMVRASVPGGKLTGEQWLALDRLADLADGTMRLTTRQGVQFHVVHKGELHELVEGINRAVLTTLAACGDVVRNTMGSPWPDERQEVLEPLLASIVARFRPQTESYWDLWVDGEKACTAAPPPLPRTGPLGRKRSAEPIYGDVYLPRKFKICVAWPGDNNVDVLANDVGIVPILRDGLTGDVTGYNLYVGGSMGMSHSREEDTYPRLAVPLGWVAPDHLLDVIEAVVTVQRDWGRRDDRQRARLKYTVEERGIEAIRAEVGRRARVELAPLAEQTPWTTEDYHGTRDGVVGLPVPSGKVADRDGVDLRTALRALVADGLVTKITVTARQDLLLHGIADGRTDLVEDRLRAHGVKLAGDVSALRRLSIACPALPTCGQALAEAERALPDLVTELEKALADSGNGDAPIRLNMTGCPNGCARPYNSEIGIVGRTKRGYDVYVGGSAVGDRMGERIRTDVPLDQIAATLAPIFAEYAGRADRDATFGDWTHGVGTETIATWLPEPVVRRRGRAATAVESP
ncbi:MAG TPA: NADPH-dependent assimilatory sulfite reductase hemoprotein subunit [Ilumatobacteraceae bacterium]|nr:NADPH-dependent assimilatory sulfite reductase hemoprotein subunit [Ilumatobacteraceae bacterium]